MERRALIAFAAASVAAFAVSLSAWFAFLALPALVLVARLRPASLTPRARKSVRWIGGLSMAGIGILPLLVTFQTLYAETAVKIAGPAGAVLGLLLAGLLWAAPELVIPGGIALLAAAGLGRETIPLLALTAAAGLSLVLHLASYKAIRLAPLLVFIAASGAIAVGVVRFLPWAQPWVEGKAGDLLTPARTARAGLSLTSRLGEIEELGLSPEIALRVWSDRPQYLRARVYKAFNGRVWSRGAETERRTMTEARGLDADLARWLEEVPGTTWSAPGTPAGGPRVRSRILLERRPPAGALLAPGGVELARIGGNPAMIDAAGVLEPWGSSPDLYAVVNRAALPDAVPEPECLDASALVDVRLQELADRLRSGAAPAERLRRTLAYLEANCTYSLKVGVFVSKDPVGEFVFDKRRGYCEYFASAAALLLRLEGVPARYVVGYSVRPSNLEGGHYVVREADAHAWVEAWIEGKGWVEVDPTPAGQFESMRTSMRGGAVAGLWERFKAWASALVALVKLGGFWALVRRGALSLGAVVALATATALLLRGWGGRRLWPKGPRPAGTVAAELPPELQELLSGLDRHWKRSGHPRPPSRAPLEHLLGLPETARSGRELVDALYRCRYGGRAPTTEELAGLRRAANLG
jgi:transglutaminase-like putative cysteine protease